MCLGWRALNADIDHVLAQGQNHQGEKHPAQEAGKKDACHLVDVARRLPAVLQCVKQLIFTNLYASHVLSR